jgi:hypothetical protein
MKTKIYITLTMLTALALGSCKKSYLDKPLVGALEQPLLETVDGVNGVLIGAYAALDGQQGDDASIGGGGAWEASPSNWIYGGVAGGDASKGSNAGDIT